MAKMSFPTDGDPDSSHAIEIDLKQPVLAGVLAWAIPGLGHVYQGRTGKGILFFVCVFGTFLYGMYIGENKVVYASVPGQPPYRWQYLCQIGVGLPATPALVQRHRIMQHKPPLFSESSGFMVPPSPTPVSVKDDSGKISVQPNELAAWTVEMHPKFEIGTVYTMIAGLLNLLVICDAFAGPLVIIPKPPKDEKNKQEEGSS